MQDTQTLPIGSILHGESYEYRIEKVLGQGSFGITYKASVKLSGSLGKLQSDITVAVKEFFMRDLNTRHGTAVDSGSDSSLHHKYRKDFIKEARNIAKLDSPHIVKVLEAFEENNTAYFSMEYIDGGNLNDYIQSGGGLSERESLEFALQISEALSYMHANMMLHLDLKPLNIMRRSTGELILIDFGLSKQFGTDGEPESSTRIGNGTIGYAPIEQATYRREDGFSPTLDIYAFGATLFKMLTGKTPPDASTVFNDGFPEEELKQRGISRDIITLASWAMEPMRKKRPQSMLEVMNEIKRLLPTASYVKQSYPDEPTIPRHDTTVQLYEMCHGFQVRWSGKVSEHKKSIIRNLLRDMKKIGDKEQFEYSEYGPISLPSIPIMSLGELSWKYLYDLSVSEDTVGWFPPKSLELVLDALHNLAVWTSLPFRLCSEDEIQPKHSSIFTNDVKIICFTKKDRLMYKTGFTNASLKDVRDFDVEFDYFNPGGLSRRLKDADAQFDVQIVCDGMKPQYSWTGFDVPYTQPVVDEISPIGFGMYKVLKDVVWNITTPQHPMLRYLLDDFDYISHIGIWHIPGPRGGYPYFGIIAKKSDIDYYYSFEDGEFRLLKRLSGKQIEQREQWT